MQTPTALPQGTRAAWVTLLILLAGALYLSYVMIEPFGGPLLAGLVLALVFHPAHEWLHRRLKSRNWAAALSTLLVLLLVLVPLSFLIAKVTREVAQLYDSLGNPTMDDGAGRLWAAAQKPIEIVAERLSMDPQAVRDAISARMAQMGNVLLKGGLSVVGAATSSVAFLFLSLITFFFFQRDGHEFYATVLTWSPLGERNTRELLDTAGQMIVAGFYGIVAVALAQGFLCGIGAWIAGLPSPLLWGVAATVASVIPLVGAALIWVPGTLMLFLNGAVGKGIFLAVWGVGVVSMVDNLVRPWVVSSRMPLNALLVFLAMLGGVQAFGVIGILTGPVILTLLITLIRMVREQMRVPSDTE